MFISIGWSFQLDDREIGFSVYLGEKEEVIIPYEKFGSSMALQNNSITCEKPGKCKYSSISIVLYIRLQIIYFFADTLCFNNKENRFRSVTLNYAVSVFPPGADDE